MNITEVRIRLKEEPGERLKAFCSITLDDSFVVRDLRIIEGPNGLFVAMPSRKLTAHCSNCRSKNHLRAVFCNQCGARLGRSQAVRDEDGRTELYADITHPVNTGCREMIQRRVIDAFEEEKARAKLPGYVPSYEDFDAEEAGRRMGMDRPAEPTPTLPIGPRGRHGIPSHQPQAPGRPRSEFGSGIF